MRFLDEVMRRTPRGMTRKGEILRTRYSNNAIKSNIKYKFNYRKKKLTDLLMFANIIA